MGKKTKAKKLVLPGGTSEKNRDGASFISFLKKLTCAIGVRLDEKVTVTPTKIRSLGRRNTLDLKDNRIKSLFESSKD